MSEQPSCSSALVFLRWACPDIVPLVSPWLAHGCDSHLEKPGSTPTRLNMPGKYIRALCWQPDSRAFPSGSFSAPSCVAFCSATRRITVLKCSSACCKLTRVQPRSVGLGYAASSSRRPSEHPCVLSKFGALYKLLARVIYALLLCNPGKHTYNVTLLLRASHVNFGGSSSTTCAGEMTAWGYTHAHGMCLLDL